MASASSTGSTRRGFLGTVAGAFVGGVFHRLAPAPPASPVGDYEFHAGDFDIRAEADAYEVRCFSYANLVTSAPGWHVRITGIDPEDFHESPDE